MANTGPTGDSGPTEPGFVNGVGDIGFAAYFTDVEGNLMGLFQGA